MTNQWEGREQGGNDDGNYVLYLQAKMERLVNEVRTLKSKAAHAGGTISWSSWQDM